MMNQWENQRNYEIPEIISSKETKQQTWSEIRDNLTQTPKAYSKHKWNMTYALFNSQTNEIIADNIWNIYYETLETLGNMPIGIRIDTEKQWHERYFIDIEGKIINQKYPRPIVPFCEDGIGFGTNQDFTKNMIDSDGNTLHTFKYIKKSYHKKNRIYLGITIDDKLVLIQGAGNIIGSLDIKGDGILNMTEYMKIDNEIFVVHKEPSTIPESPKFSFYKQDGQKITDPTEIKALQIEAHNKRHSDDFHFNKMQYI